MCAFNTCTMPESLYRPLIPVSLQSLEQDSRSRFQKNNWFHHNSTGEKVGFCPKTVRKKNRKTFHPLDLWIGWREKIYGKIHRFCFEILGIPVNLPPIHCLEIHHLPLDHAMSPRLHRGGLHGPGKAHHQHRQVLCFQPWTMGFIDIFAREYATLQTMDSTCLDDLDAFRK